jgi:prevent-host-death family protein
MAEVNVHEAKTHLSKLLRRVTAGEEIIIARAGRPVARLVLVAEPPCPRELGKHRDEIWIADDFDTLDPEILADFEGRD